MTAHMLTNQYFIRNWVQNLIENQVLASDDTLRNVEPKQSVYCLTRFPIVRPAERAHSEAQMALDIIPEDRFVQTNCLKCAVIEKIMRFLCIHIFSWTIRIGGGRFITTTTTKKLSIFKPFFWSMKLVVFVRKCIVKDFPISFTLRPFRRPISTSSIQSN